MLKKCSNGLLELGSKITIDNVFMGSIVVGQFLTEKPDINFFMEQARNYGFNEPEYILAVKKIPLISHEKINAIYQSRKVGFEAMQSPSLVYLGEACSPPRPRSCRRPTSSAPTSRTSCATSRTTTPPDGHAPPDKPSRPATALVGRCGVHRVIR